jgi:hypothetical protein
MAGSPSSRLSQHDKSISYDLYSAPSFIWNQVVIYSVRVSAAPVKAVLIWWTGQFSSLSVCHSF